MATLFKAAEPAEAAREELDRWIAATQRLSLLRFITCGSVDDGKSTLIGRLLYDSRQLLEDQLAALASDSRKHGTQGQALDFALLVDGLSAEREQGITIDVAYRFFATQKRKFIVADTPGHDQYTRNMVTGASTADLVVILVDARKGILTQTKRHSLLVHLLGIRHVVLAVNKMDLVGYDEDAFTKIVADYSEFSLSAGIENFAAIPVSGLAGDNVTEPSANMPWYRGPSLLTHLETVPAHSARAASKPFRMAVQWVSRPDTSFRGFAGRIASGRLRPGDPVVILPGGQRSVVERIITSDANLAEAMAGQSVTLTLGHEVDCSRGDTIVAADAVPGTARCLDATLVWMSEHALIPHRSYWLKIGARTIPAKVDAVRSIVEVNDLGLRPPAPLRLNDIGKVAIDLEQPIAALTYAEDRKLGGFILIDRLTSETVAAGLVDGFSRSSKPRPRDGSDRIRWVMGEKRFAWATRAAEQLRGEGHRVAILDQAAIAAFGGLDLPRAAREAASLLAGHGVEVLLTIEVPLAQAHPGRHVNSETDDEGGGEWVI